MEFTEVITYEFDKQRVAVHKDDEGNYFVTNTLSGKTTRCFNITHAIIVFDHCIEDNLWKSILELRGEKNESIS
jgi:hypothetical protein